MDRSKLCFSIMLAKIVHFLCRLIGSRASALPGKVARKICPDMIGLLSKKVRKGIIVVCGTNGKTTTNNLINTTLVRAGYKTICNSTGANMLNGIAAAFCRRAGIFGTLNTDYACLEVDEANLRLLFKDTKPSIIVVTNLFNDQLDRYGEVGATVKLLQTAFDMVPDAKLILNADDPVTSAFGKDRDSVYYSAKKALNIKSVNETNDVKCPICEGELLYDYYMYGQLGSYKCEKCGYKNPPASYVADNIRLSGQVLNFDIFLEETSFLAETEITGLYNVYNMLMSYVALDILGIDKKFILSVLCSQKPQPGRMSRFDINGKTSYLLLSKNPTGFNQSITTVINDDRKKSIMLALNNEPADGEDISWISEVDFETLNKHGVKKYIVSGKCSRDMALRLEKAGADKDLITIYDTLNEAVDALCCEDTCVDTDVNYALVNYSAMYPVYKRFNFHQKKH